MSQDQNAERSHSINTCNSYLKSVEEFKYFETTLTNQNSIQEEINPFQSNFSANRILPSSYLLWAGKRLVDYLLAKVRTT